MNRESRQYSRKARRPLRRQFSAESLEPRLMLSATGFHDDNFNGSGYAVSGIPLPSAQVLAANQVTAAQASGPISSLLSIPKLNSLPGAKATVYLDFNGHFEPDWLGQRNIRTPVFDLDNKPASFSDAELAAMRRIWEYVAEDFAPFNINVTTVEPKSFADRVGLRVSIGGDGAWLGAPAGGVAPLDAWTNGAVNTVYVFTEALGGVTKFIADATSHEIGHAFGLQHQSLYDADGNLVEEYHPGFADGRGLIMGVSYNSPRATWWVGQNSSAVEQDDMTVIARTENGFGYKLDDHGNNFTRGSEFAISPTNSVLINGILTSTLDEDYFRFTTGAGTVTFTATVPKDINNLDLRLELRDSKNQLLYFVNPTNSFDATLTYTLSEGRYTLVVASEGGWGDVGPYTVTGAVGKFSVAAPTNLKAQVASATRTNLSWTDKANNENGFEIERSTDGKKWVLVGTTVANRTSFADTQVKVGTSYQYRVRAQGAIGASIYSNVATTEVVSPKPLAPSNLTVSATDSQVTIRWKDNSGNETRFAVQRSSDNGRTWTSLGTIKANQTTVVDRKVNPRTAYQYRVAAVNDSGRSAFTSVAKVTTPGVVLTDQSTPVKPTAGNAMPGANTGEVAKTKPAAPSNLTVSAANGQITVRWKDNSNNEVRFAVQRSADNGRTWTALGTINANETLVVDSKVSAQTLYQYRVAAINDAGRSAFTKAVNFTTPAVALASSSTPAKSSSSIATSPAKSAAVMNSALPAKSVPTDYVDQDLVNIVYGSIASKGKSTSSVDAVFASLAKLGSSLG